MQKCTIAAQHKQIFYTDFRNLLQLSRPRMHKELMHFRMRLLLWSV
jgi:hypothetical protein